MVTGLVVALSGQAAADHYQDELKRITPQLKSTPPAKGMDKAPPGPPGWCAPLTESPYMGGFANELEEYYKDNDKTDQLASAARHLCKNVPRGRCSSCG